MLNKDFTELTQNVVKKISDQYLLNVHNLQSDINHKFSVLCSDINILGERNEDLLNKAHFVEQDVIPLIQNLISFCINLIVMTKDIDPDYLINNHCLNTLIMKEKEYSKGKDRFDQFKEAAIILKCSPAQALLGMMIKHYLSIDKIFKEKSLIEADMSFVMEKFGDLINYCFLLIGVLVEQYQIDINKIK